jgi:hypothetical protein
MKAKEFDEIFDAGDDVTSMLDLSKAQRPFHDQKRGITIQKNTKFFENTEDSGRIKILQISGWLKLLEPSWINLGIMSSLLGGIIFLIYFCNIRYFPELDSQSLLFFLSAITPLGLILFLGLAIFLLLPGFMWTSILDLDISLYPLFSENRIIILKDIPKERIKPENKNYVLDKNYKFSKNNYIFNDLKIIVIYIYTFFSGFLFFTLCVYSSVKNIVINEIVLTKIIRFDLTTKGIAYVSLILYILMFIIMILVIHKNLF